MIFKKYLPNTSSLKHYAGTNIITNLMIILNIGFFMGFYASFLLQLVVEINQYRIAKNDSNVMFNEYWLRKRYDIIWDCIFAILGCFATLIIAIP